MGRVRRDLGFRPDPGELSRLSQTCGSFERQIRKRGTHNDRRAGSSGFRCKNGEKEREQNAERSR
eukprot:481714-Heterocapsa_arctica.AAC.1